MEKVFFYIVLEDLSHKQHIVIYFFTVTIKYLIIIIIY